ncbi:MAG TPA: RDD family protein, partial [Candidatus Nanoarchaeia archaeon]
PAQGVEAADPLAGTTKSPESTEPQVPTPAGVGKQTVDPIATTPQSPVAQTKVTGEYAGFWIRLLAAIIDGFILGIIGFIIMAIFGGLFGTAMVTAPEEPSVVTTSFLAGIFGTMQLLLWAIDIAYFVGLTGTYGATLGKMVLGLRVVGTNGQKISFGKAALREIIGKWISAIVFCLGYLWVAFDEKKQGWHDKIAGTYVVKVR